MSDEAALHEVLRVTARVRVSDGGATEHRTLDGNVLVDISEPRAIAELLRALEVQEVTDGRCMCAGDLGLEFFGPDGIYIAVVGFHHASHIRWKGWSGDAFLCDGRATLHWLAAQGADGPLEHQKRLDGYAAEGQRMEEDWSAAAPAVVRDVLDLALVASRTNGVIPEVAFRLVGQRLDQAFPDPVERAAALLAWYGSGSGLCTGYPVYEDLPQPALVATSIAHLVQALQAYAADTRITTGAIRHLCGWKSRPNQARDIGRLPAKLRARLLDAARESGDDDKRNRAEKWLGIATRKR